MLAVGDVALGAESTIDQLTPRALRASVVAVADPAGVAERATVGLTAASATAAETRPEPVENAEERTAGTGTFHAVVALPRSAQNETTSEPTAVRVSGVSGWRCSRRPRS